MLTPVSYPSPAFPRIELDDIHTVPTAPLRPTRLRGLKFSPTLPTFDAKTVKLTDPVLGAFVVTALLTLNPIPE